MSIPARRRPAARPTAPRRAGRTTTARALVRESVRAALLWLTLMLAFLPLAQLFQHPMPLIGTVAAGLIAVGVVGRAVPRLRRFTPPAQILLLLIAVGTWMHRAGIGPSGLVDPGAWKEAIIGVFRTAGQQLSAEVPPVALSPHLVALAILVVGLVTLIAEIVLMDMRRALGASIVPLTLGLVPALHIPDPPFSLLIAPAAGALVILAADPLTRPAPIGAAPVGAAPDGGAVAGPAPVGPRPTSAAARAVPAVVAALVIALALAAAPLAADRGSLGIRPSHPLSLERLARASGGPGLPGLAATDSISVRRSLTDQKEHTVLTYTVSGPAPDGDYLRVHTLTRWDGEEFTSPDDIPVRDPQLIYPDRSDTPRDGLATYTVTLHQLRSDRVPTPPRPVRLDPQAGVDAVLPRDVDEATASDGATSDLTDLTYRVTTVAGQPTAEDLAAVTDDDIHRVAPPVAVQIAPNPQVTALAEKVRAESGATTPFETARAFEQHFHTGYTYSLDTVTPPGADPLTSFLEDRTGYCEQFAAAFALMMNAEGYPTRVVVGYTGGTKRGDHWEVTNRNAHAWPEVWFGEDYGWVRFEPTPPAGGVGIEPLESLSTEPDAGQGTATPTASPSTSASTSPSAEPTTTDAATTPTSATTGATAGTGEGRRGEPTGAGRALLMTAVAIAAAATVLAAVLWVRHGRRGRAQRERNRAWDRALASDTPDEVAAVLALAEARRFAAQRGAVWDSVADPDRALQRLATDLRNREDSANPSAALGELAELVMPALYGHKEARTRRDDAQRIRELSDQIETDLRRGRGRPPGSPGATGGQR
ncbi:DUF3488 and transglutaminase-like domain-containing protein [Helcobacillus sp. ACRRO]|uniref:DUF3488 and transglutaminase-like domain-containing protein n=1 Tax=Helcobacillus sp. ACRRO TaxID=2918202 RepID=UPI001EF659DA|nr:DUF3488 and transglutaminase-like domain-containing protein [Helcobacillus sp. ACRRO]MCG7426684.1 DUF3488 and transglutaminase-like domain-containing protein [Helcobacillus sp. ACRRO]